MRLRSALCAGGVACLLVAPGAARALPEAAVSPHAATREAVVIGYSSPAALERALARYPGRVVRTIPTLRAAEVLPSLPADRYATAVSTVPGIVYAERPSTRVRAAEPALALRSGGRGPHQWQYVATRAQNVPEWVQRAASGVTIAVIDTGADLEAPDIGDKNPAAHDVTTGGTDVTDTSGHGTFVAALAAGSVTNGEGIAGAGGDAQLLVVKVTSSRNRFTDVDGAAAIVYAVDQGARVLNLSFGGHQSSSVERRAIEYAVERGALVVAAAGNDFDRGSPVAYPAALLQPVGSRGRGGRGLSVAASSPAGKRAWFSSTGSWISLAAPGLDVLSAVSSLSSPADYPRVPLPGSLAGLYGYGSGTSYAAPQVAGAAALLWAANPMLSAAEVARILKQTAQGGGRWTPGLGWGVLDVGAAVAAAAGLPAPAQSQAPARTSVILTASRTEARNRLRLTLAAALGAGGAPVPTGGRDLLLESFDGTAWRRTALATTGPAGQATWRFSLGPGRYRLRARFAGDADLPAATSKPVAIAVRSG